jgi:hypothetical protein
MANEYTLADYELTATPLTRAVVRTWREASPILDMQKFKTTNNLTEEGVRFNSLPTVPWRKIGESFSQLKVIPDPWKERVHFMGAKIDIPREYVKANSIVDNRVAQTEAVLKGAAFAYNDAFFNNTPGTDEDAIIGLFYRINNDMGSNQLLDASLDVSPDTAVTSWQHKMFDKVDDLIDRVDGMPGEKCLFMGRTLYFRFVSALRSANQLFTEDYLGRALVTYGKSGAKIFQAGYKANQTAQILGDVEVTSTALTGGALSSMYCVRFGEPYLAGWCQEMPNAEDKGETEDGVNLRTIVRFSPGLYIASPRAIARAFGWTAA